MTRQVALLMIAWISGCVFAEGPTCHGRFANPITDVCWSCIFPITIGPLTIPSVRTPQDNPPASSTPSPICYCPLPAPGRIGIRLSFWEPVRLVDVTRSSFCFPALGGLQLSPPMSKFGGAVSADTSGENTSKYHVHYYIFPLLYWMNLITDFMCLDSQGFDLAYMSELDPTNDSTLAAIMAPESILFANPVAQAATMFDCVSSSAGFPLDFLFWSGGCSGSIYPLTTEVQAHISGNQASSLLTQRVLYKLHRTGVLRSTMGELSLCNSVPMPIWRKSQYRISPLYPVPAMTGEPFPCSPVGRTTTLWESGREFPIVGEDFVLLVWRRRECCAF